jgi:tetratricopeptide (TPR) repeat protein
VNGLCFPAVLLLLLLLPRGAAAGADPAGDAPRDRPLAAFQVELLELGFAAASAIPPEADLSDRSRAQESIMAAWLELHQPTRVLKDIAQIGNWRRGAVYADLAMYLAQQGPAARVPLYLDNAAEIAKTAADWEKDRIRVQIARVHARLGQHGPASQFQAGVDTAEQGKVLQLNSAAADDAAFDAQMAELERLAAQREKFDVVRNALRSAVEVYDLVYEQPDRRRRVESLVRASWNPMPIFIRIELLLAMAEAAHRRHDQAEIRRLAGDAGDLRQASQWTVEDEIPLILQLARWQHRAGAREEARRAVAAVLERYDTQRELILSSLRAPTLLLAAEAFQEMGEREHALAVYKKALAEGAGNPNGRPRALDLAATCRSLALHACEPDAQLWENLRRTLAELRAPW